MKKNQQGVMGHSMNHLGQCTLCHRRGADLLAPCPKYQTAGEYADPHAPVRKKGRK